MAFEYVIILHERGRSSISSRLSFHSFFLPRYPERFSLLIFIEICTILCARQNWPRSSDTRTRI